jgi:1-acyl-sn-glycerol-3-phosphate acyltransferase
VKPRGGAKRWEWAFYSAVRAVLIGFAKLWFRLGVEGRENVPEDRPFIVSSIHRSNIDFLLVLVCGPRHARLRYMGKDSLWKSKGWARLFTALGGFPVARGTADREALRTCVDVIEHGESLVMFPEGTRQSGPEIAHMFDGPAFVQSRTGAPILPVGIGGSEAAMPKGAKFIRPRKITVVIGKPLEPPLTDGDGGRVRRQAVRDQTAALGEEIQLLFDEAQRQAGTPNRREVRPGG